LNNAAQSLIEHVWNTNLPVTEIFVQRFNITIQRKDLLLLSDNQWLNDELVNFYMNMLVQQNLQDIKLPKV
jgi:sentrin-specific protease 1